MNLDKNEIEIINKQISPIVNIATCYVINSVGSIDRASVFLKQVKDFENSVEEKRLKITQPLNQSLKEINDIFKKLKEPLIEARVSLTKKIIDWKTAEAKRLEVEEARRRKIQEAHEVKGHEVKDPVILERPDNKIGNTQTRKVWKWRMVSFSKLSDAYKTTNDVYINQKIREGAREIEGLEIYQEEQLSIVGR